MGGNDQCDFPMESLLYTRENRDSVGTLVLAWCFRGVCDIPEDRAGNSCWLTDGWIISSGHPALSYRTDRHLSGLTSCWLLPVTAAHQRLGHVASLRDVLAVFLVGHADPLFGHHLPHRC